MSTSGKLRNLLIQATIVSILTVPILAQSPETDQLLKSIPAETLFCVRINNFNTSLNQIDQFLTGVSPVGVSMLVKTYLTNLLGSPQLAGLNIDGSFAAFGSVLNDPAPQPGAMPNIFIGVFAPVADYQQFLDGISSKTPADANGIVKVLSLGKPVILVTKDGNYALATWANQYDNLVAYKKMMNIGTSAAPKTEMLRTGLGSSESKQAVSEPFWIYANIQQVNKTFAPFIAGGIAGIKAYMQNIPSAQTGLSNEGLQNIMNMYVNIIEAILKEVKSVSFSMNPKPTVLNITKITTAVTGTEIAKMFASNPSAEQNNLFPYLEDGAMMNFAFLLNSPLFKQAIDLQVNLIAAITGKSTDSEDLQKMKTIAENMIDTIKGPAAYTISVDPNMKPPFKGSYVIAVKDEKKFQQLMNDSIEMMTTMGLTDLYKSMGIEMDFKINKNAETYKNISIDSAQLTFKLTEANSPQAELLDKMYGSGFDYRWGMVNGLFAVTIGANADTEIHELIDKIQSGTATQVTPEIKTAMSLVPDAQKADFFVTMNFLRIFKLGINMASSVTPLPIPPIDDSQTTSNLVIDGKASDGKMTVHVALPKEHLQEIMRAVMTIEQKMIQTQPSAQPPVTPDIR